jgi:hypothetical protein
MNQQSETSQPCVPLYSLNSSYYTRRPPKLYDFAARGVRCLQLSDFDFQIIFIKADLISKVDLTN